MNDPIPDLMLEKLALDELPTDEARALRSRLDDSGRERLAAIEHSNAEILRELPPSQVAADVHRRLAELEAPTRERSSRWLVWAPVAAAAGVALMWWVGRDGPTDPGGQTGPTVIAQGPVPAGPNADSAAADDGGEKIFLKGDPRLMIDRIEDRRPVRMDADDAVGAGDLLQLGYAANEAQQGVIVSIDGAGVATLHFPDREDASTALRQGGRIPLGTSYELDDAPKFERFFFVTVDGDQPQLRAAEVMDAARALASSPGAEGDPLALPDQLRQQSITLRK
ncbi:MAG: hypothetical protein K0V04_24445 [Deltaproteobacteria bacterium]|nr:hypothetical protein [Deltaproteobacteria bacterium]